MTVNELARAAGVDPGKVRYYARRGLLPARRRRNCPDCCRGARRRRRSGCSRTAGA